MKAYTIHAIREKARRTGYGQEYIDDCEALSETWDEPNDMATFTESALAELRDTWPDKHSGPSQRTVAPCAGCRGLS